MKAKSAKAVKEIIHNQMSKLARKLTPEQRKANGKKAWQTRRENLAKQISDLV